MKTPPRWTPPPGEPVLYEYDSVNLDGKIDYWVLMVDDRPTTILFDGNWDGAPDICWVYGQCDGRLDLVQIWTDDNVSKEFDGLAVRDGEGHWTLRNTAYGGGLPEDYFEKHDPSRILERPLVRAPAGAVALDRTTTPVAYLDFNAAIDDTGRRGILRWTLRGCSSLQLAMTGARGRLRKLSVWEEFDGQPEAVFAWTDVTSDCKFDYLTLTRPGEGYERWYRILATGRLCYYTKEDYRAMVRTRAKAGRFGSRILDEITTMTILLSEVPPRQPTRQVTVELRTPILALADRLLKRGAAGQNAATATYDATGRLISLDYTEKGTAYSLRGFLATSRNPRRIVIDNRTQGFEFRLYDDDHDGTYDSIDWTDSKNRVNLTAHDANDDGKFDSYRDHTGNAKWRSAEDKDNDGIIDRSSPPEKVPEIPRIPRVRLPHRSQLHLAEEP